MFFRVFRRFMVRSTDFLRMTEERKPRLTSLILIRILSLIDLKLWTNWHEHWGHRSLREKNLRRWMAVRLRRRLLLRPGRHWRIHASRPQWLRADSGCWMPTHITTYYHQFWFPAWILSPSIFWWWSTGSTMSSVCLVVGRSFAEQLWVANDCHYLKFGNRQGLIERLEQPPSSFWLCNRFVCRKNFQKLRSTDEKKVYLWHTELFLLLFFGRSYSQLFDGKMPLTRVTTACLSWT